MIVVCKLLEIAPHENADRLFVAQCDVGANRPVQVVTNVEGLQVGDLLPLACIGHAMPEGYDVPRVKRAKLRGVVSEGMFVSWEDVRDMQVEVGESGQDVPGTVLVADPVVVDAEVPRVQLKKISEIRNAYQLDLDFFAGREVVVMEKLDGSSHRIGFRRGLKWCGGHNRLHAIGGKTKDDSFGFGEFVKQYGLVDRIADYCQQHEIDDLAVYGEFCGPKIQKNGYELTDQRFYVFDMAIDEQWQDWDRVIEVAAALQFDVVPVDDVGIFDLKKIDALIAAPSQFGLEIPREGVVVKLRQEGVFDDDRRAIFKHKPAQRQERKSHRGKLTLSPEEIAFRNLQETVADYVTEERVVHAISHLREDGETVDFPSVVREMQRDILKEAEASYRKAMLGQEQDFRKIVSKLVGRDRDCKRVIFAALEEN